MKKVNIVEKDSFEADRAYTAGFLDADGAIMATIEKHQEKKFGFRVRVTVKITQKETQILEWFQKKYKVGLIRKNRRTSDWIIRNQKDVEKFIVKILPYIKTKKKQAKKALKIVRFDMKTFNDLCKVARTADSLSNLNVRSKNRRTNYASMVQDKSFRND